VGAILFEGLSWVSILLGSFYHNHPPHPHLRMPDVFTRMHAASVTDTLGAGFLIIGMAIQAGAGLVTLKLFALLLLFFFFSPVVTHALARACHYEGIKPMLAKDRTKKRKRSAAKGGRRS
jgi:multicomponent Na+:H+ antiporter subunit G